MKLPEIVVWKSDLSNLIRNGEYLEVIKDFYAKVPDAGNGTSWFDQLDVFIETEVKEDEEGAVLCLGIAALALFVRSHWTGPPLDEHTVETIKKLENQATPDEICKSLVVEDTVLARVKYPELLSFALKVFEFSFDLGYDTTVTNFWRMRGYFTQQQVLDEISPILHDRIKCCMEKLTETYSKNPECRLEKVRIYMYYLELELAQKEMDKAQLDMNFSYHLTGVLGKRTKFQQHDIPQLLCTTKSFLPSQMKKDPGHSTTVPFSDDVQLEHMLPADGMVLVDEPQLKSIEYAFLLAAIKIRMKTMPNHVTCNEENKSIVDRLFRSQGSWAMTISATLIRMDLVAKREKNISKALAQIEWIIQKMGQSCENPSERLDRFFISYLPAINDLYMREADYYLFYHDYKMALDIYEKLQKWQLVIECLIAMNERNRAEVLIKQQLTDDPSNVALLCYLGDITEDPEHYAKALEVWGKPSVRVHRHWGLHFYKRKQFPECIEHLKKSLGLNRFQPEIWLKLGWCAITLKDFELGAKSYKQYCMLESDDREAWDNLAHCYDQLGENEKAVMILKESLKVDISFWKTWDSLTVLYTKLKKYDEALSTYQKTLKLNPGYKELNTLKQLFTAYVGNGDPLKKNALAALLKESVKGREINCELLRMYADLVRDTEHEYEALMSMLEKTMAVHSWEKEEVFQSLAGDLLDRLLPLHLKKGMEKQLFRFTAQPVISAVLRYDPDNRRFSEFKEKMETLFLSSAYDLSAVSQGIADLGADNVQTEG